MRPTSRTGGREPQELRRRAPPGRCPQRMRWSCDYGRLIPYSWRHCCTSAPGSDPRVRRVPPEPVACLVHRRVGPRLGFGANMGAIVSKFSDLGGFASVRTTSGGRARRYQHRMEFEPVAPLLVEALASSARFRAKAQRTACSHLGRRCETTTNADQVRKSATLKRPPMPTKSLQGRSQHPRDGG